VSAKEAAPRASRTRFHGGRLVQVHRLDFRHALDL
jgi:hypothetical protein